MGSFFIELAIVMAVVLVISLVMEKIKQPLLIGYILTGILASPLFFNILSDTKGYETFSHIGIALLLFIVGLHLNLKLFKEVGLISIITGLGQVFFTSVFGFLISYFLGYSVMASILIAIALTFSSTIIIVKLLSDKKDLDTLYGKISMGFLIVQDLVAVIILMILSSFLTPSDEGLIYVLLKTLSLSVVSIFITYVLSKHLLPKFLEQIAKSTELLFVFILTWCFGIAALFDYMGFSLEIGALLAGVALASSPYNHEINARIKPLRDFFIVMFFILLGSQMIPVVADAHLITFVDKLVIIKDTFMPILVPSLIFSIFVLIGNPLIVLILMTAMGYSSRTGFLAGLTVAQISEFSLILAMLGKNAGFLSSDEVSMITLTGIITITASTYLILNGNFLYKKFHSVLKKFEGKKVKDRQEIKKINEQEIVVFGYDRIGFSLLDSIEKMNKSYIVMDYNPSIIEKLEEHGINCIYGDANDIELLEELEFAQTEMIISTIPAVETNLLILEEVKKQNRNSTLIFTANHIDHALDLYSAGADYVILPHFLGGDYIASMLEKYRGDFSNILREKVKHISDLKKRKNLGHRHPQKH